MGELHLEIFVDRMKREFGVEANVGKPQVAYRETITARGRGRGQIHQANRRQRPVRPCKVAHQAARGYYPDKKISKNTTREDHFGLYNIKGGVVPREFIGQVEKGVREAIERGIVAGFKMVDISCELYDGSYHDVDYSEIAFKIAASMAFQDAAKLARPVLLEPIMKVEVVVPEQFMGEITGSLSGTRTDRGYGGAGLARASEERGAALGNVWLYHGAALYDRRPRKLYHGV